MILSMTAFGRAQLEESGYSVTVEIKALNGRFLDVVIRLPRNFSEFEEGLRKQIAQVARRGRIEAFIQAENTSVDRRAPRLNLTLARHYWDQLQELHRQLPGTEKPRLESVLGIPYIFETSDPLEDRDLLLDLLKRALAQALDQVQRSRAVEGETLLQDLLTRLVHLRADLSLIDHRKGIVLEEYIQRLKDRIADLLKDVAIDENRLLQEVACLAERSDINEELVRFRSHLDQVEQLISAPIPVDGRKLDFFIQELLRETNTIGSKTNDLETVQAVVRMKSEIGKLKEQVQNIE